MPGSANRNATSGLDAVKVRSGTSPKAWQTPTWAKGSALVGNWALNQLADRLLKLAETRTAEAG
jgi:hypothetical protein